MLTCIVSLNMKKKKLDIFNYDSTIFFLEEEHKFIK